MSKVVSVAMVSLIIVSFLGAAFHPRSPECACPLCSKGLDHVEAVTAKAFDVLMAWHSFSFKVEDVIVISQATHRVFSNRSPPFRQAFHKE